MLRVVSLIASATEILHALGLGKFQVGRSHECDYPPSVKWLPVCTAPKIDIDGSSEEIDQRVRTVFREALSVYDVYDDVLERLQPTHVLTQSQCEVCAVSLKDVERAVSGRLSCNLQVVSLNPNDLEDVFTDISLVATALGSPERGDSLVEELRGAMSKIAARAADTGRKPTIACIEWLQPLMVAGNWMPRLVDMAGGRSTFEPENLASTRIDWEELEAREPDVIMVAPCGFDIQRTESEMYWLDRTPGWQQLKAVQNNSVYVADGNQFFNRPGPRLVESLRILAEVMHPSAFFPSFENVGWRRFGSIDPSAR